MPRKTRQLQLHKATGQWAKRYTEPATGKKKYRYLGKANLGPRGEGLLDEAYDTALANWQTVEAELRTQTAQLKRQERIAELECFQRLAGNPQNWARYQRRIDDLRGGATVETEQFRGRQRNRAEQLVNAENWSELSEVADRLAEDLGNAGTRTVGAKAAEFLAEFMVRTQADQRSGGRFINVELGINQFRDWIGIDTDIDEITSAKVRGYYEHLLGRLADPDDVLTSTYSARDKLQIFKQFVRWLGENEYIAALPANLDSRQMVIEVDDLDPKHMTPSQFQRLLAASTPKSKLYWLLMANCGMTQIDIAELRPRDIHWGNGLIVYKRQKLKRKKTRKPKTYKLWPETLELLKEYASRTSERALLGRNGLLLARRQVSPGGDKKNVNAITNRYNYCAEKAGLEGFSATDIRNTAATVLKNSRYAEKRTIYTQHSATNTTDRHYAVDYDNTLDGALAFLREKFLGDTGGNLKI